MLLDILCKEKNLVVLAQNSCVPLVHLHLRTIAAVVVVWVFRKRNAFPFSLTTGSMSQISRSALLNLKRLTSNTR